MVTVQATPATLTRSIHGTRRWRRESGPVNGYGRRRAGGGGVDKFRIKIWQTGYGAIVYDNLLDLSKT